MPSTISLENAQFRACSGDKQGFGATLREALDSLMEHLTGDVPTPIVIWPFNRGDAFFTDAQHGRLQDLKSRREILTDAERDELERLVETEFEAAALRTQTISYVPHALHLS